MSHHEFRKNLSKKMREEFYKKNEELERVEKSPYYSEDLKQRMILEINEVFERQMDEFRQIPWYKEAREAHNKVIESKIKLLKTLKEKEDIQKKYEDLLKKSEKDIIEKKNNYQESRNSYLGDCEDNNTIKDEILKNSWENEDVVVWKDELIDTTPTDTDESWEVVNILENSGRTNDINEDFEYKLTMAKKFKGYREQLLKNLYFDLKNIRNEIEKSQLWYESDRSYFERLKAKEQDIITKINQLWWEIWDVENMEFIPKAPSNQYKTQFISKDDIDQKEPDKNIYHISWAYNSGDYYDIQEYNWESRRHLYDKPVWDKNEEEEKMIKFLDNEDLNTTDSDNLDVKQPIKQDKNIQLEKRKPCNIITKTKSLRHGGCIVEKWWKYWLLNSVKKVTIPLEYDSIEPISEVDNYYIIGKWWKYGLINRSGKEILPLKYDDIEFDWEIRKAYWKAYYYIIKQWDKYWIFKYGHSTRKLSDIIYDEIITFEEVDQDSYLSDTGYPIYKVRIWDKYWLVNRELNSVLPVEYDDIKQINCWYIVKKWDKYWLVDKEWWEIISPKYSEKQILKMSKYDQIEKIWNMGFCMWNRKDWFWIMNSNWIMNSKWRVLLPTKYSISRDIIEWWCFIWTEKDWKKEYWFIDDKWKAITQMDEIPKYNYIKKINWWFLVSIAGSHLRIYNEKWKLILKTHYWKEDEIDKNFIESVMKYESVEEYNGYYIFEKDGKWWVMDEKWKEKIKPEYLKVQVMQWLKPSKK